MFLLGSPKSPSPQFCVSSSPKDSSEHIPVASHTTWPGDNFQIFSVELLKEIEVDKYLHIESSREIAPSLKSDD